MDRRRQLWLLIPSPVRRLPADLGLVIALTVLTIFTVLTPVINDTPLRVILGLPFVLFLPGYAFIAALFPEAGEPPNSDEEDTESRLRDRGIDGIERVALSFGLSIAIVPLIGLILNFTPWGITLGPILLSVSGFTVACTVIAQSRRQALPAEEQFVVPFDEWIDTAVDEVVNPVDRTDAALNVLLAVSVLLALGTVGYAIAVPPQGEQFTEFYILTEDDDGEPVAANYPTNFTREQAKDLIVGVTNNEHASVSYTVVIQLQAVEHVDNQTTVIDRSELDRFDLTLAHNETWQETVPIAPDIAGDDLRLQFLLYEGPPPPEPTRETAYRDLHLWISVE